MGREQDKESNESAPICFLPQSVDHNLLARKTGSGCRSKKKIRMLDKVFVLPIYLYNDT